MTPTNHSAPESDGLELKREAREGGYIFVTSPLFSGWSYMLHPRENDNSLYQSLAYFCAAERAILSRRMGAEPVAPGCGETDCTFQDGWCKCGMEG